MVAFIGVFRTLKNIYDGASSRRLKTVNYFFANSYFIDVTA